MSCCKQVELGVGSQGPESVVLTAERLHSRALGHVPNTDALVLCHGNDELLTLVEDGARHVVGVASAGVDFPSLGFWIVKDKSVKDGDKILSVSTFS